MSKRYRDIQAECECELVGADPASKTVLLDYPNKGLVAEVSESLFNHFVELGYLVELPDSAGAWAGDTELMDFFVSSGTISAPVCRCDLWRGCTCEVGKVELAKERAGNSDF